MIGFGVINVFKSYHHFHYLKALDKNISKYDSYLEFSMWSFNIPLKLYLFFLVSPSRKNHTMRKPLPILKSADSIIKYSSVYLLALYYSW